MRLAPLYASLTPAVETVDAVYCVTIEAESGTTPTEAGIEAEIEQGTNMAEVAAEIGIEQFVFSSVAGAERDTGIPNFESKYDVEQRIRNLGLPATILRPVTLMQNYKRQREAILNGTLASPLAEGVSMQMVDVGDIGALAATALATPEEYVGETIEVAGDEHTLESAAAVFTTVTGIDVDLQYVPIEIAREENRDRYPAKRDQARCPEAKSTHGLHERNANNSQMIIPHSYTPTVEQLSRYLTEDEYAADWHE